MFGCRGQAVIPTTFYSPDFNPIEEFFAELKHYINKVWLTYVANPDEGFRAFLRKCVHSVGERRQRAEGHFHAGITLQHFGKKSNPSAD
jgi:hypothetical protein